MFHSRDCGPDHLFEKKSWVSSGNYGHGNRTTIIIEAHVFGGHVGGGGDGEEGCRDGVVGHEFEDLVEVYLF